MEHESPLIVIADDDPDIHDVIEGNLFHLKPRPRFVTFGTVGELLRYVRRDDVDISLVTLDLNFSKEKGGKHGLEALPRLLEIQPRVPIVLVSGELNPKVVDQAKDDMPIVRAIVEKGTETFDEDLIEAARKAIAWGREQRQKADAILERAVAAQRDGHVVDAGRLFIEAHKTGDLSAAKRTALRKHLGELISELSPYPDLHAEALRALMYACWDCNDEVRANYYARAFIEAFPRYEPEAHEFLALVAEIGDQIYDMVDERLEIVRLQRERGNFSRVLEECHRIQDKLGNVLPSYRYEADAYCQLGRYEEGVEAYFRLADIALKNGELDTVTEGLSIVTRIDRSDATLGRVEAFKRDIVTIRERIRELETHIAYPYLRICAEAACRSEAELSNGFFRVFPDMPLGDCDLCGVNYQQAESVLAGKTITLIGGRFAPRYQTALARLGARDVLHHDAINEIPRIPALISAADAVLIITGYASHAGTIKAESEIARQGKISARVHFYGVNQVVRGVIKSLVPDMAKAAQRQAEQRRAGSLS